MGGERIPAENLRQCGGRWRDVERKMRAKRRDETGFAAGCVAGGQMFAWGKMRHCKKKQATHQQKDHGSRTELAPDPLEPAVEGWACAAHRWDAWHPLHLDLGDTVVAADSPVAVVGTGPLDLAAALAALVADRDRGYSLVVAARMRHTAEYSAADSARARRCVRVQRPAFGR